MVVGWSWGALAGVSPYCLGMQDSQPNVSRGFAGIGALLCALVVMGLSAPVALAQSDTEQLLAGVGRIGAPGVPGPVLVIGEDAFGVVTPREDQAVVAAARAGRGRIVAFGHGGFFGEERFDTTQLVANAVVWAGNAGASKEPLTVFGLPDHIAQELERRGVRIKEIQGTADEAIALANVIVLDSHRFTDELSPKLGVYLRRGGGLVTAGLGWGWLQLNAGRTILDHPGNKLLRDFGLAFGTGTLGGKDGGYDVTPEPAAWVNAADALEALAGGEELDDKSATSAARSVSTALSQYPGAQKLSKRLRGIVRNRASELTERYKTMSTNGLTYEKDAMARLAIDLFMVDEFDGPAERVRAHASAGGFPGAVDRSQRRVAERVEVDTSVRGWHSTGLYAAAGDRITVLCPQDAVGRGFHVQIGSHLDPESRGALNRLPRVVRRFSLQEKVSRAANAVGGLVYIDVPQEIAGAGGIGELEFEIRGAVRAPVFFRGETDESAWREEIRHRKVPWGELVGDDVVLTLPVDVLADLENPGALITFWDNVVAAAGSLQPRRLNGMGDRPVRLIPDVSVSWGYMYAPHDRPLTFPMHSAAVMTDLETLSGQKHGDVWGLFHELGHFHQDPMWTFGGTGEVTVNIFTLYVLDKVCGIKSEDEREQFKPEKILQTMREHNEAGAPFDVWKSKPFLALRMYVQIQQAFGWDAYEKIFSEYRALVGSQKPKNDDEKRDQWMVRMSRTVGRDLGPFFEAWGVPTSDEARRSISHLQDWMPDGWLDEPFAPAEESAGD